MRVAKNGTQSKQYGPQCIIDVTLICAFLNKTESFWPQKLQNVRSRCNIYYDNLIIGFVSNSYWGTLYKVICQIQETLISFLVFGWCSLHNSNSVKNEHTYLKIQTLEHTWAKTLYKSNGDLPKLSLPNRARLSTILE